MNNIEILEKLKDNQYTKETLITLCKFYDEEFKPYVLSTEERDALENLIKENKELKERCKELIKEKQELTTLVEDDSIPKSKVKEKLKQIYEEYNTILADEKRSLQDKNICSFQHEAMRTVLEELLEEGES